MSGWRVSVFCLTGNSVMGRDEKHPAAGWRVSAGFSAFYSGEREENPGDPGKNSMTCRVMRSRICLDAILIDRCACQYLCADCVPALSCQESVIRYIKLKKTFFNRTTTSFCIFQWENQQKLHFFNSKNIIICIFANKRLRLSAVCIWNADPIILGASSDAPFFRAEGGRARLETGRIHRWTGPPCIKAGSGTPHALWNR